MGIQGGGQVVLQQIGNNLVAATEKACREDDFSGCFCRGAVGRFEMQAEMIPGRFNSGHARAVARMDIEKPFVPAQVAGPIRAFDAVDGGVGVLPMTRFIPGLETECRDTEFGSRQRLGRAQQIHAGGIEPDTGTLLVRRGIQHGDFANSGPAQCVGAGASGLTAADDRDVMVDARAIRNPVGRIGTEQAQRCPGMGVWIV